MTTPLLMRLDARDRMIMLRCAMPASASRASRAAWVVITHLGGTGVSLLAAGLPLLACCQLHDAAKFALAAVALSHIVVQIAKRTVGRRRPARAGTCVSMVREPDRFSFPSGHATASMSVALAYGIVFPTLAVPLFLTALLVGFSRVRLGVHYPSDVLVGQLIALATVAVLSATT